MKELCILIVNYKSTNYSIELIKNLKKSSFKDFDILVFDNNSNEDLSKLEKLKIKLIKNEKNVGLTGGVNKALNLIKNKYVLLLNPDIEIEKNTIKELLDLIKKDEKIAFVGGAIYNFKNKEKVDAFGGKLNFFTGIAKPLKNEYNIRELKYREYSDACVLIFNKKIFQELNGYDEKYFMYVETEDIQFRAMKKGYNVFINPKAKVWHRVYGSTGGKKSSFSIYYLTRNRFLFMNKHLNFFRYYIFLIINIFFILPMQFLLFLFRRQFYLIPSFLKGAWDGILK